MENFAIASALEVSRPKTSGPSVNVHVVKTQRFLGPDFDRMKEQIQGDKKVGEDK